MRFGVAIFLSILFHAVLAAALAVYVDCAPAPDALAQLDLSSVDLSFAETEDETAAVQPTLASVPDEPVPEEPPPPAPERPPESEPPKELPPEPDALKLPEPPPERPPLETPKVEPPKKEDFPPKEEPPPRPPAVAPRQARVDAPPSPRKSIKPDYPKGARQRGEQGDVTLELHVTASGTVGDVTVVSASGYPELDEAAVRAVRAARFTPAKRGRQSVASMARITLTFRLK